MDIEDFIDKVFHPICLGILSKSYGLFATRLFERALGLGFGGRDYIPLKLWKYMGWDYTSSGITSKELH